VPGGPPVARRRHSPLDRVSPRRLHHCGFCLPACPKPTASGGKEADFPAAGSPHAPRPREKPSPAAVARHLSLLGCLACLDACRSGWHRQAIEDSREELSRSTDAVGRSGAPVGGLRALSPTHAAPRGNDWRRVGEAGPSPGLVRRSGLTKRFPFVAAPGGVAARDQSDGALFSSRTGRGDGRRLRRSSRDEMVRAKGLARLRVGMLTGCVQQVLFAPSTQATVRVLSAEGARHHAAAAQGMLRRPHAAHGQRRGCPASCALSNRRLQRRRARRQLSSTSAGCGSAMKRRTGLLAADLSTRSAPARSPPRCATSHELSAASKLAPSATGRVRVAYHMPAILLTPGDTERTSPAAPSIPGYSARDPDGDTCCGSAGIYNLLEPSLPTSSAPPRPTRCAPPGRPLRGQTRVLAAAAANLGISTAGRTSDRAARRSIRNLRPDALRP